MQEFKKNLEQEVEMIPYIYIFIFCPCRRFIIWSSRMWEDHDRQGNSQSLRVQIYQPSGLHTDRHVVR